MWLMTKIPYTVSLMSLNVCFDQVVNTDINLNILNVQASCNQMSMTSNPNIAIHDYTNCWTMSLRNCSITASKCSESKHIPASTSLLDTLHNHIWLIKHDSMLLLLIPFTGWCTSPPTHIFPRRAPPSRKRWSQDEAANRSGLLSKHAHL